MSLALPESSIYWPHSFFSAVSPPLPSPLSQALAKLQEGAARKAALAASVATAAQGGAAGLAAASAAVAKARGGTAADILRTLVRPAVEVRHLVLLSARMRHATQLADAALDVPGVGVVLFDPGAPAGLSGLLAAVRRAVAGGSVEPRHVAGIALVAPSDKPGKVRGARRPLFKPFATFLAAPFIAFPRSRPLSSPAGVAGERPLAQRGWPPAAGHG